MHVYIYIYIYISFYAYIYLYIYIYIYILYFSQRLCFSKKIYFALNRDECNFQLQIMHVQKSVVHPCMLFRIAFLKKGKRPSLPSWKQQDTCRKTVHNFVHENLGHSFLDKIMRLEKNHAFSNESCAVPLSKRKQASTCLKDPLHALQNPCPFKGDRVVLNKHWLYSPVIGCTLPARVFAPLNGTLLIFVGVMTPD